MGRLGITEIDVEHAIDQLVLRGKNPTIDSIREVLGRGSKTTISNHFQNIKKQSKDGRPLEHILPERLMNNVQQLWAQLNDLADERIAHIQHDSEAQRMRDQEHIRTLLSDQNRLSLLLQEEIEKNKNTTEQLAVTHQELSKSISLNHTVQNQMGLQEKIIEENKAEIHRLHDLAKHMQENLEHYQNAIQKQRTEHMLQSEKLQQQWKTELAVLTQKNTELYDQIQHHQGACAELNTTLQLEIHQKNTSIQKLEQSTQQLQHIRDDMLVLQERNQQLQASAEEYKRMQVNAQEAWLQSNQERAVLQHQVEELRQQNRLLIEQLDQLKHEYQFVSQEKHELQGQLKHIEQSYVLTTKKTSAEHV